MTALVIAFILVKYQNRSIETQFIVAKAKNWIKLNHSHKIPTISILNEAETYLREQRFLKSKNI